MPKAPSSRNGMKLLQNRVPLLLPSLLPSLLSSLPHSLLPPPPPSLESSPSLRHAITQTLVIACTESTQLLEDTLVREGLTPSVLRQQPDPQNRHHARSALVLLNHCQAWQKASEHDGLTLVVEADFVPVQGMGALPMPFNPDRCTLGMAWLYTCAAQIYSVSDAGHANGFSASTVAYVISRQSAIALLSIVDSLGQISEPTLYTAWDCELDRCLRQQGFENFIPFRNYGEHGGRPNPEHKRHGLSAAHRADVLYGPLSFTPIYARPTPPAHTAASERGKSDRVCYLWTRFYARIKGLGRLLLGRFLHSKIMRESSVPLWLIHFAIRRHCCWHL